jgi:hypothetical protein
MPIVFIKKSKMRDLTCLNTIVTDDLAAHIDLTSLKSWDLNSGFTSNSLTKWSGGFSNDVFLYDFGLTGFDNGRVNKMTDSLSISATDNKLQLFRVAYNTPTGGTFYDGYEITGITTDPVGNYFKLNGGYLQGFFKLNGYDFQVLPYRYGKGVTLETIVNIEPASFDGGYFLFMGARAEDKYIPEFSGECNPYTATTTTVVYGSKMGYEKTITEKLYSGVTTSLDHYLNSLSTLIVPKKAINDEKHTEEIQIENLDNDIDNNVIGFYLSTDGKIGFTKFNEKGILLTDESSNIVSTGWTIITIQFKPYDIITDKIQLDCAPVRKGDFNVFVNGRLFWKIKDFDEFYFRGFKNDKEKQLGLPYNVSWGGGSFGLEHSYHWEINKRVIFDENSQIDISTGYTFINNPNIDYDCPPAPVSGYTQYLTISGDNTTFSNIELCEPFAVIPNTVLAIIHDGSTGETTTNEYFIEYTTELELISNRDYTFNVSFYDRDIFALYSTSEAGMFFFGNVDIMVLEEIPYSNVVNLPNQWFDMKYKIRLKDNTNKQNIKVGLYVKSDMPLVYGFSFYFDKFTFFGADKLLKDVRKNNQRIEKTYSNSFTGGIQKLRIYDNALSVQEILHNAMIESRNVGYNLTISKGGRLIYG